MPNREPFSNFLNPKRFERYIQAITYVEWTQARIRWLLVPDASLAWKIDMLRRMSILFRGKFGYAEAFFMTLDDQTLERLLIASHVDISRFIELSLLPTPLLLTYLFEWRVAELKTEKDRIKGWGFDKESRLHRELEYSKHRVWSKEFGIGISSPFWSDPEYRLSHETEVEREIEAIVADNKDIQAFIETEAWKGKVLVLWNDRYGSYYVGKFLTQTLENNTNIRTGTIRVSSTQYDSLEKFEKRKGTPLYLTPEARQYIEKENPTIIVIDGTKVKGYSKQRFPGSMTKIHFDFERLGKYKTRFWIPGTGEIEPQDVSIWSWWYPVPVWDERDWEQKDLIFLRANGRSFWHFNDPEDWMDKQVLVFGEKWLTVWKYYNGTLATLFGRIREAMEK